ncbi:hypothetical protein V5O48_019534, partial [Marasmius crinis-equi]
IEKLTAENVDRIIELVQEFSRSAKHERDRSVFGKPEPQKEPFDDELYTANLANVNTEVNFSDLPENGPYTDDDIPKLRARWLHRNADMLGGVPEELPPFRAINHRIQLIDESKKYTYYLPRCPDYLKNQLNEKLDQFTCAEWWIESAVEQAAPMLCIPKKNGKLRTIVDY